MTLSVNSFAVNHCFPENAQQSLAGTEGLHLTEPFPHTFLSVDIQFKGRSLGDLVLSDGVGVCGEMWLITGVLAPPCTASWKSPFLLERDSAALYSLFIYTGAHGDFSEKRKLQEPRAQCHQKCSGEKRLTT